MREDRLNNSGLTVTQKVVAVSLGLMALVSVAVAVINNISSVPEIKASVDQNTNELKEVKSEVVANSKELVRINEDGSRAVQRLEVAQAQIIGEQKITNDLLQKLVEQKQ